MMGDTMWQAVNGETRLVALHLSYCVSLELSVYKMFESTADKKDYKWAIRYEGVCVWMCVSVSNIAGRLKPTNTGSLLPALSYLSCCLSLSPAHCTDRGTTYFLPVSLSLCLSISMCVFYSHPLPTFHLSHSTSTLTKISSSVLHIVLYTFTYKVMLLSLKSSQTFAQMGISTRICVVT